MYGSVRQRDNQDVHFWTVRCAKRLTFFHDGAMRDIAITGLDAIRSQFGVCLIGYVIMPEHVHVLLYPRAPGMSEPIPFSTLLRAYKQHVGFHGKQRLRQLFGRRGRLWTASLDCWAAGHIGTQSIWAPRGHFLSIENRVALMNKLEYCHANPVSRGLVDRPRQWLWSSYRFYHDLDDVRLPMNWNGAWPVAW